MPLVLPPSASGAYEDIKGLVSIYYEVAVEEAYNYGRESAGTVLLCTAGYFIICVLVYWLSAYIKLCPNYPKLKMGERVMIVTAHPDDECMFFGPLILKLIKQGHCNIYLVCLSKGNHDKQGDKRKQELWESCRILGIPDSNITLVASAHFPDDPNIHWREDILSSLILNQIEMLSINTVITFDKDGVSRHRNHCSLFYAVAFLCLQGKLPSCEYFVSGVNTAFENFFITPDFLVLDCRAYALESTSLLRKYSWILDAPLSYVTSPYWFIVSMGERKIIKRAMEAHASQMVWFRKLYLLFSRYLYINTVREIEVLDLELDLDLRGD